MAERELLVRIIGDDRDLQRAFTNSERRAGQFDSRMTKVNQGLRGALTGLGSRSSLLFGSAAFLSTATLTAALESSVSAASDLNEEIAKSRQIFGDASGAVDEFARNSAQGLGVSRNQALAATGTFGNLFTTVGLGEEAMARMSQELVTLAADLASFNNADISEVLAAIRSGLIGEAEPLRRFGVLLSETRVQQEAMAATGKDNVKELTNQEKALARYNIILGDTAPAQGDFQRTSQGLANQSRVLKANLNDLSADIGSILVPVLNDAVEAANLLFTALDRFRGVDFSPGFDFPEPPDWLSGLALAPISPLGAAAITIKRAFEDDEKALEDAAAGPGRGIGEHIAQRQREQAKELEQAAKEAARQRDRASKSFAELTLGLGLKLDKAALTKSTQDDLAVLKEIERAIRKRIDAVGRTFALEQVLTDNLAAQAQVVAQQREDAAQKILDAQQASQDAYDSVIDALQLKLDQAGITTSLQDDLAVLKQLETRIRARIKQEGETTDLLRQLFDVQQQQAQLQKDIAERGRDRRQGTQFEALGLTAEGDKRVPGVGALRRRLGNLREAVEGTVLDTAKTASQLDRIASVLSGKFGKVGKDVRQSILQMLNDISSALEGKGAKTGPMTKFQKRGIGELIEGLGLSDEEVKALRQRFAQLGPGGTAPGQGIGAFGFAFQPGTGSTFATQNQRNVEEFHIYIDGEEVESRVTKRQQRKNGRTAKQRRGTRPGI